MSFARCSFSKCPVCEGDNLQGGKILFDTQELKQPSWCLDCGAEWIEVYAPSRVEGLVKSRTPSAKEILKCLELERTFGEGLAPVVAQGLHLLMNGDTDPEDFHSVKEWVRQCYYKPSRVELVMAALNELLETHGVEVIPHRLIEAPIASYCNTGDTYACTVLYCYQEERFMLCSWGDYVESLED